MHGDRCFFTLKYLFSSRYGKNNPHNWINVGGGRFVSDSDANKLIETRECLRKSDGLGKRLK